MYFSGIYNNNNNNVNNVIIRITLFSILWKTPLQFIKYFSFIFQYIYIQVIMSSPAFDWQSWSHWRATPGTALHELFPWRWEETCTQWTWITNTDPRATGTSASSRTQRMRTSSAGWVPLQTARPATAWLCPPPLKSLTGVCLTRDTWPRKEGL